MSLKMSIRPLLIPSLLVMGCSPLESTSHTLHPVRQHVANTAATNIPEEPALKRLSNGHYRLRKTWTVELDGRRWVIPKGYSTNGITAPSYLKKSLGDGVEFRETWAAVFHDWLFTQAGVSRSDADQTFHHLLLAYGVSPQKAQMLYMVVSAYSFSKSVR